MDNRIILIAAFLLLAGCISVRETSEGAGPSRPETGLEPAQANNTSEPLQPPATPPTDAVPPTNTSNNNTPVKGEGTIVDVGGSIPIRGD